MGTTRANPAWVFLNVPYDHAFEQMLIAYVAGVCSLGLLPRATLEIPATRNRLDRILDLIESCGSSIHDLSRVQLDKRERLPRFNMPFEMGLALGRCKGARWAVFEAERYRLQKTLSDLNGYEALVHEDSPEGVLRELLGTFDAAPPSPTLAQMQRVFKLLQNQATKIKRKRGVNLIVDTPSSFKELVVVAARLSEQVIRVPKPSAGHQR